MINILTEFDLDDVVLLGSINLRLNQLNSMFPVSIANGGTGTYTSDAARQTLGILRSEHITFSGTDTLALNKSIRNYSYIEVQFCGYGSNHSYGWYNSTCFSVDVLGSTASHALTVCGPYSGDLLIISALMWVSGSGITITLDRNKGFAKTANGSAYLVNNQKIQITKIIGYK